MEGGILTHKHDNGDWRLRNFREKHDNHPIDPNWETGCYIKCHKEARDRIPVGWMLFDVVFLNGKGVFRLAFQIERAIKRGSNRILYFKKFWYPTSPQYLTCKYNLRRTRHPKSLNEQEVQSLIRNMQDQGYVENERGTMPLNVNPDDWNDMLQRSRGELGKPHTCR